METIRGIVDHDTIRLVTPLALPQGSEIEFEPRVVVSTAPESTQGAAPTPLDPDSIGTDSDEVYEILNRRYRSGHTDTAARVDELDP
jgi:hypothetical protein